MGVNIGDKNLPLGEVISCKVLITNTVPLNILGMFITSSNN